MAEKGLNCPNPNCGEANQFTTGQMKKEPDCLRRPKTCKKCGTIMETVEVPVKVIELKNGHMNPTPQ